MLTNQQSGKVLHRVWRCLQERTPWSEQKSLRYLNAFFFMQLRWSAKRAIRSENTKNYNMYKEQRDLAYLNFVLCCCVSFFVRFITCKYTQDASLTPDAWGFWDRFESHRERKRLELTKSSMYRPPMRFRAEPMTRVIPWIGNDCKHDLQHYSDITVTLHELHQVTIRSHESNAICLLRRSL